MEVPYKCKPEDFLKIYQEHYKKLITYEYIRKELGLPDSVRLKLNGTFKRYLYLLDEGNSIYAVVYKIQTALWYDEVELKWQYVSIFPSYIKKYVQPSIHMLEYVSCEVRKGEGLFDYIDDPETLLDSEDRITRLCRRIEKDCESGNYPALLNSRYTQVYNKPLVINQDEGGTAKRFSMLYLLVLTSRMFFGQQHGVLPLVNTIIPL